MLRIARLFLSLGAARLGDFRGRTGQRILFVGLLAGFGLLAAGFGLAAVTVAIAAELGLAPALAIMALAAVLCCLVIFLVMNTTERQYRQRSQQNAQLQQRLSQAASLAALGAPTRAGRIAGLALLAGALVLLVRGSDDDDQDLKPKG
jgi:hypothetical protein